MPTIEQRIKQVNIEIANLRYERGRVSMGEGISQRSKKDRLNLIDKKLNEQYERLKELEDMQ